MVRPERVENNFIDESHISATGVAIPYERSDFSGGRVPNGLEVTELTWEEAGHYFEKSENVSGGAGTGVVR